MQSLSWLRHTEPVLEANLALDEALLVQAEEGGPSALLRVWEPADYAVILGASGKLGEDVRLRECRADGVAIARRSSGGGTVVIGPGVVNIAVVLPIASRPELVAVDQAQIFILEQLAEGLRRCLELPVEVRGSGDLTLHERKFAGSAQRRLRKHVLVHSSILVDFPLERISRYLHQPSRQPSYRADRSHHEFVCNLGCTPEMLLEAVRDSWSIPSFGASDTPIPVSIVERLLGEKFLVPGWVERF